MSFLKFDRVAFLIDSELKIFGQRTWDHKGSLLIIYSLDYEPLEKIN